MHTLVSILITLFVIFSSFAAKPPDLAEYEDVNESFDVSSVFSETFDRPLQGWVQPKQFQVKNGEGFNGTSALYYERNDKEEYLFMSKPIELDSRVVYECSFLMRTEDIDFHDTNQKAFKDQVSAMGIQYRDKGVWVGISPSFAKHKELKPGEWQTVVFPVRQPTGEKMTASFDLYLRKGITGKMWIDEISVKPVGMVSALVYPIASSLRLDEKGTVKMKTAFLGKQEYAEQELALLINAGGRSELVNGKDGTYEFEFGSFPSGEVQVDVKLLNTDKKLILASDTFKYYSPKDAPPEGVATIDEHGRLLVDAKPFMPVAAFSGFYHPPTAQDIERLKKAGFNTLMYYHPFKYLWVGGKKETQRETILASLDELQKQDMKLIFAVFRQNLPNQPGSRMSFDDITGLDNVTEHVVGFVKDHPAILAYYLSDENPLEEYPSVKRLRERVSKIDSWHPTITLTCRTDYFAHCAHTGDIFSYDYYPINTEKDKSFSFDGIKMAGELGVPHWFTPQAFNWGIYRRHHAYDTYRYPTEEEMRSLNLAAAIYNSKGFMFYSYAGILSQEEVDSEYAETFWSAVSEVATLLRELEPWMMSIEQAPEIAVNLQSTGEAKVIARAFSVEEEKCVLIVSSGPGETVSEINVPGSPNLKSKYGRTENLGDGKYLFKGKDISSDVLVP